ncbi:M48 metallopeptidase family protein [Agarivorans sp. MS3-6]|uniref:M48 metallopeptidase family protein n=1 Tax=Agarivorans sp. TSD2052 TaxID=2937286 RepID=UPI00200BF81C|nr:M48 family metallopeptidase [Agarivorans sp. TSD2052]UPW18796.1 M48 family metallopeptidase [Agarivorans sp. TSD2052]
MNTTMSTLKYLNAYPAELTEKIQMLLDQQRLAEFLLTKYPTVHTIHNDKELRDYATELKSRYMRKSAPLSKVIYDKKIHVVKHALGLHSYVSRVQGNKLKSKNEIRISSLFQKVPEPFLNMIVVHELAHLKEKQHDKAFYQLCQHMLPNYHQLEFDTRVYLTQLEIIGPIY